MQVAVKDEEIRQGCPFLPWPAGTLDVLVASKYGNAPAGLSYLPCDYRLKIDTRAGWPEAANALLDNSEGNVLFMDDDTCLTPTSLAMLPRHWDKADIFGFTLIPPEGLTGFNAGWQAKIDNGIFDVDLYQRLHPWLVQVPSLVAFVTASCFLIKEHVVKSGLRFPEWPGMHHEDRVFCLDAWLRGFKVAYLPGPVLHSIDVGGMGATKRDDPDGEAKRDHNKVLLKKWCVDHKIVEAVEKGIIPAGEIRLDEFEIG